MKGCGVLFKSGSGIIICGEDRVDGNKFLCKGCLSETQNHKRLCAQCKKPMFNSWQGEWIDGEFIEIHSKCKEAWESSENHGSGKLGEKNG